MYETASAFAAYSGAKGRDANWQLQENGVMTGVVSSSMSGTRVSGFREAIFGSNEKAKTLPRNEIGGEHAREIKIDKTIFFYNFVFCSSDSEIEQISGLTDKLLKNSAIAKKGYK